MFFREKQRLMIVRPVQIDEAVAEAAFTVERDRVNEALSADDGRSAPVGPRQTYDRGVVTSQASIAFTNGYGLIAAPPFGWISKCRWGVELLPVLPL